MTESALPPLPEPDGSATVIVGSERLRRMIVDVTEEHDAWSEAPLRAWGKQCYEAGLAPNRYMGMDMTNNWPYHQHCLCASNLVAPTLRQNSFWF